MGGRLREGLHRRRERERESGEVRGIKGGDGKGGE